jgi:hypothetical protein
MFVAPEWIEAHCVIPDGFRKGAPFALYNYQLEYFGNFYLVKGDVEFDAANPILAPAFVYRRGVLVGPQKLGKGPHTAAHVCLEGVGPALFAGWAGNDDGYVCADHGCGCGWEYAYEPGEPMGMPWPTPLIQITATSEEQTDNIYDALRPMIEHGPLADVVPKTGEEFIRLPGGGRIDTVTSSATSRLGQRVTFVPQDEVGLWTKLNKMSKVADTQYRGLAGMGGRASLTTNAWDPTERSVAQEQFESTATDILRQFTQPPKSLKYRNKRDRARIHRIVYPPDTLRENGGHIDLDSIEAEAADLAARDPSQAARFYGNILESGGGQAIDATTWKSKGGAELPEPGARIGVGFDGSISDDTTALVGCTADERLFLIAEWSRPRREDGTPDTSWRVPRGEVAAKLAETFDAYDVGRMFGDPPKWETELDTWADTYRLKSGTAEERERVLLFDTFQHAKFARSVDRFVTGVSLGGLRHCPSDGDVMTDHVLAAVKKKVRTTADDNDNRTLYVFVKPDDGRKIDIAVAGVLAYEAAMTMPSPRKKIQAAFAVT